jgi:hypothetical protein
VGSFYEPEFEISGLQAGWAIWIFLVVFVAFLTSHKFTKVLSKTILFYKTKDKIK